MIALESHPIADIFPMMSPDEFESLKADIKSKRLEQPIWIHEGKILDGRNRYRACQELGIDPLTIQYSGDDPIGFVMSSNQERRHLTAGQKAAVAVELLPFLEEEARKRMLSAAIKGGSKCGVMPASLDNAGNKASPKLDEPCNQNSQRAADQAGKKVGVGRQYISEAKKLKEQNPDDFEALKSGATTFSEIKSREKAALAAKKAEILLMTSNDVADNRPVVHHKSCLELLGTIEDQSIDLLITDPPYSTDVDDIDAFVEEWLFIALEKLKDTARAYICIGAYPNEIAAYLNKLAQQDRFIVDCPLVWTYRNTLGVTPKRKYNLNYQWILHLYTEQSADLDTAITNEMFSVQDINAPDGRLGDRFHTWQKPDELANRLIRHSTTKDSIVLDPFACTGTFLIAASKAGLKTIGGDISADNLKIAEARGCNIVLEAAA